MDELYNLDNIMRFILFSFSDFYWRRKLEPTETANNNIVSS